MIVRRDLLAEWLPALGLVEHVVVEKLRLAFFRLSFNQVDQLIELHGGEGKPAGNIEQGGRLL